MNSFNIKGNVVDLFSKEIFYGEVVVKSGRISEICKLGDTIHDSSGYILPGFTDAHVHIESSLLVPSEFARLAVLHGTVSTVSDPHEIANVCGMEGVKYMIENGQKVSFKFYFGAPSCVPATIFETAGNKLNAEEVDVLLQLNSIHYLSEMMNFPGVLSGEEEVMKKIASAKKYNKPVDGHAPGLRGEDAQKYIAAGISTDHECYSYEEALEKIKCGMKILIREGSAAKNFDTLIELLNDYPEQVMFCSDDKHPDSLLLGHINQLCARAVKNVPDIFKILQAACINPVFHYNTNAGLLRKGDDADFIVVSDLKEFTVLKTFIKGELVAKNGISLIPSIPVTIINHFSCNEKSVTDFQYAASQLSSHLLPVIEALEGQLITNKLLVHPKLENAFVVSDVEHDILKIAVINRYKPAPVAISFIKNFGIKSGAIASSVAHDSHNIIAIGVDDESICKAVNLLIKEGGGLSAVNVSYSKTLPLPVAGLMSNKDGFEIAAEYAAIDKMVKQELGSTLASPFMTLSFMALLVIPHLKLSDLGLFDSDSFKIVAIATA